jgi:hypothetical protein
VDAWTIDEKNHFIPSRLTHVEQNLDIEDAFAVLTTSKSEKFLLISRTEVTKENGPVCKITFNAWANHRSCLMICIRPYNPEGVSFIKNIDRFEDGGEGWIIDKKKEVYLDKKPSRYIFANYNSGDLCQKICKTDPGNAAVEQGTESILCNTGMATSAALYPLNPGRKNQVIVTIPLSPVEPGASNSWFEHTHKACALYVPDQKFQFLYNAAIKTMILHSPGDIYPGPFTYKRFWFRDAAFILQAMMATGLFKNIEKIMDRFPGRQTTGGHFMSQDGEWDSNGEAIWIMKRFMDTANVPIKKEWIASIYRGAQWICRKRRFTKKDPLHAGLLPAGFSAEHFGPSDFYYWDDFWGVAGLKDASALALTNDPKLAEDFRHEADDLLNAVEDSVSSSQSRLHHPGIPASPSRRMDASAIGSLVASYPLQIWPARDARILETAKFLMDKYFLQGAYYHEISHSGINIYLTLHIAHVLLRAGNSWFFDIVKSIADLATPTGQWPEAIHPRTKGGCMGDGQHIWASAEWVMMMRNMFVREEQAEHMLVLCSGIPQEWLKPDEHLFLGPTQTLYGEISVTIQVKKFIEISWQARWHGTVPRIEIRLPGYEPYVVQENAAFVKIEIMKELHEYIDHDQYV